MGMFSKLVAFLDKAAGVPAWITHADNIRKLGQDCPSLVQAIISIPEMDHVASWSKAEIWGIISHPDNWMEKVLPEDTLLRIKKELVASHQDHIDTPAVEIVEVDALSSLAKFAEEVFADSEVTATVEATSTDEVTATVEATSTEEIPTPVLDPQARMILVQGMTKVISRGRKVGPTLKVLKTMAGEDQAAIIEALSLMESKGNSLAKSILEDPSL